MKIDRTSKDCDPCGLALALALGGLAEHEAEELRLAHLAIPALVDLRDEVRPAGFLFSSPSTCAVRSVSSEQIEIF